MHHLPFALRTLTAVAAAAALLAACGGGSDDPAAAAAPTPVADSDDADAATLEQVAQIRAQVETQLRAVNIPPAGDQPVNGPGGGETAAQSLGWFPGVKQTNLIANKLEFGAQIVDPDLKNPWGIAIRPAGLGLSLIHI